MPNKETFYITTPIYYPSDNLHIGHAYCHRRRPIPWRASRSMEGYDTFFLTGTGRARPEDRAQGRRTRALRRRPTWTRSCVGIKELWKLMDIDYDDFIRTTGRAPCQGRSEDFPQALRAGRHLQERATRAGTARPARASGPRLQLKDGNCPDCGRPVEKANEEAYFFKPVQVSALADRLHRVPSGLHPARVSRKNEMLNNFLLPGLEDLCVSRTSFKWGMPVDF